MIMNDIIEAIKESSVIGITFHASPDGDSLGSALGLMLGLRKINKKAYIMCKERVPEQYHFLPNVKEINENIVAATKDTDCVIVLDCGNIERINCNLILTNKEFSLINIDHHISNNLYGDLNYVDTKSSAVGEIIYKLLRILEIQIDKDIANCLYTAIITDCGVFKYSNTTAVTHSIAGDLINTGIDFSEIHRNIYDNKKYNRVKLFGRVIDNLYLSSENKICIMELTKSMLKELQIEDSDTSDIINIGVEIEDVEVAVLFKEAEEGTKVSLRSKNNFDVRKIAEYYSGGGHTKAAGFFIDKPIDEAKLTVLKHIEKELI